MKPVILSLVIFFLLTLSSIALGFFGNRFDYSEKNPFKLEANRIMQEKLFAILPKGATVGEYPKLRSGHRPTNRISFDFALPDVLTNNPEEAKQIFMSYLEKIIAILNTTPQIRPYLERFPIDAEMFSVSMIMNNKDKTTQPFIGGLSYDQKELHVIRWSYNESTNKWSYDECLTVPADKLGDILSPNGLLDAKDKKEIHLSSYRKYTQQLLDDVEIWFNFFHEYGKKEGCIYLFGQWYLRPGYTTKEERMTVCLDSAYCSQEKQLTLEEAKQFIRRAAREHLAFYRKDTTAIRQVTRCQTENKVTVDGKARQENLSLRFLFWDKYIDYVQPPYIAEIYVYGRKAYYFTVDERQRPVLVFQEELPNEWDEVKE